LADAHLLSRLFMIPVLSLAQIAREDGLIFNTSRTFKDPTNFNLIISDTVA